ncbi:MAG: hypothetical protein ACI4J3_08050 [Oscillospiraceae bacterium]
MTTSVRSLIVVASIDRRIGLCYNDKDRQGLPVIASVFVLICAQDTPFPMEPFFSEVICHEK